MKNIALVRKNLMTDSYNIAASIKKPIIVSTRTTRSFEVEGDTPGDVGSANSEKPILGFTVKPTKGY